MDNNQYQDIISLVSALTERVKTLEEILSKPQMPTRLGPSSTYISTGIWGDIKEGGPFDWKKLR
jgi:hypothetical protein